MKPLSEKAGLERLRTLKDEIRRHVAEYEARARSCSACDTPGACCLDEHFVNVRISRLEAVAIALILELLPPIRRSAVYERIFDTADASTEFFACPLYERGTGCLVHKEAKPVACIVHACYERAEDLPPQTLQDEAELKIDSINDRVYGPLVEIDPLPKAVHAAILRTRRMKAITRPDRSHPAT